MLQTFSLRVVLIMSLLALSTQLAWAHVVVNPKEVGIAADQTFEVTVPNEKEAVSTTGLRLMLPSGLKEVSPKVQANWKIDTKKDADGNINEIDWTGGDIPVGLNDVLAFSAQVPATSGELDWKAYQTYSDGSVVAWDQKPTNSDDTGTPYSVTRVVNDLTGPTTSYSDNVARILGLLGLLIGLMALVKPRYSKI